MLSSPEPHTLVCVTPEGTVHADWPRPAALLPGSFNPLHVGHTGLAAAAAARLGVPVAFELSVANVDKPELSAEEVNRRVAQFAGVGPVWVTRAATFAAKVKLFPGAAFVLGFDTAARLVDPKYYRNDPSLRDEALRKLLACGGRVIVGGRVDATGVFREWTSEGVTAEAAGLFVALTETDFRLDVSSTELRARTS